MGCNLTELRKQMDAMQELLDTYEHCHVDSVTPEEKAIVEKTKAKCVEAIKKCDYEFAIKIAGANKTCVGLYDAIKAITDVE